jgi:hypothetical protein
MKNIGVDKTPGVIISQGNSLYDYLYLKPKCHVFCFIFSLFSPTKSGNRMAEQFLPRGEVLGKGGRTVNKGQ